MGGLKNTYCEQADKNKCLCLHAGRFSTQKDHLRSKSFSPLTSNEASLKRVEAAVEDASVQESVMAPGCLSQAKKGSWRLRKSSGLHCFSFFMTFTIIKNVVM